MKILRAYKTELAPNDRQRTLLLQHAGAARVAYNWGLRRKIEAFKTTGKSPSAIDLHRELNKLKDVSKVDGGFSWMRKSSKCAPQEALRNLDIAFSNFFRRCKNGAKKKGFPKFKSRKRRIGGFRLTGTIKTTDMHVQLPRLGRLRLKELGYLPHKDVKALSATMTEKAGHWFISLQVEQQILDPVLGSDHIVGVDVGVRNLAVTSDGKVFENPKAFAAAQTRLRRLQKSVSRKCKCERKYRCRCEWSQNRKKANARVSRLHYRIGNIRRNALHQVSSAIVKSASVVVLESLNVAGMIRSRQMSKALSDASMAELHRQIEYKAKWQGIVVVKADRFYPSSKTCSRCKHIKQNLARNDYAYKCETCGLVLDRDLNAAINLKNLAGSSSATACGEISSGSNRTDSSETCLSEAGT